MAWGGSAPGLSYSYDGARATPPPTPPTSLELPRRHCRARAAMTSSSSVAAASSSSPHLHITITNPSSTVTTKSHHHHNQPSPRQAPQHSTTIVSPRSSGGGGGGGTAGGSGGTNQACAACKYQRRKCNPDCLLAPYFPADQHRRFLNAHRLFGVSNILKTLRRLKPELCDAAMHTLIYQAEMRAMDPVGGCFRTILDLERQLDLHTAELSTLLHHLSLCRQAAAGVDALPAGDVMDGPCTDLEVTSNQQPLLLSADQEVVDTLYLNQDHAEAAILNADHHDHDSSPQDHGEHHQQQQQQQYDYFYYETTTAGGEDPCSKTGLDINVDVMQPFDYDSSCDADHKVEELAPVISSSSGGLGQQLEEHYQIDQKEYQMKVASLVDVFDVRQELQAVDVNADIDVKEELDQEEEDAKNNVVVGEAAHMSESSHCRLGLGFSSF